MDASQRWPRSVGGHVALDFVNTDVLSQDDQASDVLRSAEEFLAWCGYAGVGSTPRSTALTGAQESALLAEAASLRSALRSVVEALAGDGRVDGQALETIRSQYAGAVGWADPVLDHGRLRWSWDATDPRAVLGQIAVAAIDLLRTGPTERLKLCPSCGFVFLDTTKNGSRRWCSMEDCGKQAKMRRYVAKRAQSRSGEPGEGTRG